MDRYRMLPSYRYYDVEGTSPLTLDRSVGKPLRDYKIYGNSIQDGTPSPDSPIEIQACGDKSKNLVDMSKVINGYLNQTGAIITPNQEYRVTDFIDVSNMSHITINAAKSYAFYDENKTFISGEVKSLTIFRSYAVPANARYIRFDWQPANANNIVYAVAGSYTEDTFPPYEPYGYKIPIKVGRKNLFNAAEFADVANYPTASNKQYVSVDGDKITISNRASIQINTDIVNRLKPNTAYSISIKNRIIEEGTASSTTFRIALLGNSGTSNFYLTYGSDTSARILPSDLSGYNKICLFASENAVVTFEGIQIEESEVITPYEPYKEPIVNNIYLDEPLAEGEYLDFKEQKIVKEDSVINVLLPTIPTHKGINVISVDTDIQPSNIQIQYYK